MLSSTMTTLSGRPRRSSAATRGIEVGSRLQALFQPRLVGVLFLRAQLGQRGVAALRGGLEFRRCARPHRIRQRGKAGRQIADEAGIEPMLKARRSGDSSIWIDGRAFGNMPAFRVPDILEERPAQQQHEIGLSSALRTCAASPGSDAR